MQTAIRSQIKDEQLAEIVVSVSAAILTKIERKGRGVWVSPHEILGIITEEVKEFTDAVHHNNEEEQLAELLDIAVSAIFGIASIKLKYEES